MVQNVARSLVKAFLTTGPEQRMQQNVIGLQRGIGFQFAAPAAVFVLLREQIILRRIDCNRDPAPQVGNLSKAHQRRRRRAAEPEL